MDKPTILIVPGGFSLPDLYSEVIAHVSREGYTIEALHLPSVGYKTNVPGTMQDDAAFIASEITKHSDKGNDVILIGHSYGGLPATESTKGLSKSHRQQQGNTGGLDDGWLHQGDISVTASNVFNDLPKEEGEKWAKMSTRHSGSTFPASLSHAGFKDVPVSYLVCTKDLAQEPELQRASIAMMEGQIGGKIDVTEIKSGHAPNASRPREVADWIISIAKQST
ncbi:uncharacterized protein DNG_03207 [Cephalotrichum gorgonifer]|uniref:AB hydrolase-1 domain-containing protein n=1 Tax=Cephalotrichum gorgonifer TaxID=2041049 RepID=A0AAE8MWM7_9PEZI|nr:uncharacterized protein DNG_03207 [Cephalotrichum gorgonifer]